MTIRVAKPFHYVGGQRFRLRDVADAEQHLFVVADARRKVTELLWLQFEAYLPGVPGAYDYEGDPVLSSYGISFFTNVRQYTMPPQPDSDRARAYDLLTRAGYRADKLFTRIRLVHICDEARRSEIMIIYAVQTSDSTDLMKRALRQISVSRR